MLVYVIVVKQNTEYEMRISDWSSDVCFSDLQRPALTCGPTTLARGDLAFRARARAHALRKAGVQEGDFVALALPKGTAVLELAFGCWKVGRVSCRARWCRYV